MILMLFAPLFVLLSQTSALEMSHGMISIKVTENEPTACKSEVFPTPFTTDDVMVLLSPARSITTLPMFDATTAWVEYVDRNNVTVCVKASAKIYEFRIIEIQWLAFLDIPTEAMAGVVSVPLWTTGTKCVDVTYSRRLTEIPVVFVSALHSGRPGKDHDVSTVWTEDVTPEDFKICIREIKNFDGVHRLIKVHWLVVDTLPSQWTQAKVKGRLAFPNNMPPPRQFQYSYCQEFWFLKPFYTTPTMIATASHTNNMYSSRNIWPQHNAITYWIEYVSTLNYQVCVKDLQPYNVHHDPIVINYLLLGDLHPCLDMLCGHYAKCKAHSISDVRCECDKVCPMYVDPKCAQDGQTYTNMCQYEQMVCNTGNDVYIMKNGSCEVFSYKHGRIPVQLDTTVYKCITVPFDHTFQPNQTTHIYLTIDFHNSTQSLPHNTVTAWVEDITTTSFSACVLKTCRNDYVPADGGLVFVNFAAYQGSPPNAVTGEEVIDSWWEGTTCKLVNFPQGKFSSTPYTVVTVKHTIKGLKHDAATIWLEDLNVDSFRVCLRELQSFDYLHQGLRINWVAFAVLPESVAGESHKINFANNRSPVLGNTYCEELNFSGDYVAMPTILLSAVHHTGPGGLPPDYNSVSTWVEKMNTTDCSICARQHHKQTGGYDPLTVSVMILGQ